jgi:hypothetical protein
MKRTLGIIILLFLGIATQAQKNYSKELLSTKWYQDVSSAKKADAKTMVFKKLTNKVPTKEKTMFRADGVIMRCFSEMESPGGETAVTCDSAFHYQVKKDLIHITDQNILHLYYKMKPVPDGIELKTIDPEAFYKK